MTSNLKLFLSTLIVLLVNSEVKSMNDDMQRKLIKFSSVVVYTCKKDDPKCKKHLDNLEKDGTGHGFHHPLIWRARQPYAPDYGNGGLLNPKLEEYGVTKKETEDEERLGLELTLQGCVSADGIDLYKFDNKYGMLKLEEIILAYMKERAVDRQMSDLTTPFFDMGRGRFACAWIECVKREWCSKQSEDDSGVRSDEDNLLIQRHLTRSVYWPSQWKKPYNTREGQREATSGYWVPESLRMTMPILDITASRACNE